MGAGLLGLGPGARGWGGGWGRRSKGSRSGVEKGPILVSGLAPLFSGCFGGFWGAAGDGGRNHEIVQKPSFFAEFLQNFCRIFADFLQIFCRIFADFLHRSLQMAQSFAPSFAPSFRQARLSGGPELPRWRSEAKKIREGIGAPPHARPWTEGKGFQLRGVADQARALEIIDLATLQYAGYPESMSMDAATLQQKCSSLYTDLSQNPARKSFTGKHGHSKCLTSSSIVYSHGRDRVVLPIELMRFQGHDLEILIPHDMSQRSLRELAGQGIFVPSLGTLLCCLRACGSL